MKLYDDTTAPVVTNLLAEWQRGDSAALDRLMPLVYQTLRSMAASRLRSEGAHLPLDPTELVHESLIKLLGSAGGKPANRAHFLALAALNMRSVLVDIARAAGARKRGSGAIAVTLTHRQLGQPSEAFMLVSLDQALLDLEQQDPRTARVVEMSYFAGMQREDIALALDVSLSTVDRELRFGRAWLNRVLSSSSVEEQ